MFRMKAQPSWLQKVYQDLKRANITMEDVWARVNFRMEVTGVKDPPQKDLRFLQKRLNKKSEAEG